MQRIASNKPQFLKNKLSFMRRFCNKFLFFNRIKFNTNIVLHTKPDENLTKKLSALVLIKNLDSFAKQHNLAKKKLVEYGYGK